jgi:hypothetical protein
MEYYDPIGRSFEELCSTFRLLEIQESGEMTAGIADKIAMLKNEIKFEKLKRGRQEYEGSGKPQSEWPKSLQGRTFCEWEIVTRKALGMEIPSHLRVSCADFIKETEQGAINSHSLE